MLNTILLLLNFFKKGVCNDAGLVYPTRLVSKHFLSILRVFSLPTQTLRHYAQIGGICTAITPPKIAKSSWKTFSGAFFCYYKLRRYRELAVKLLKITQKLLRLMQLCQNKKSSYALYVYSVLIPGVIGMLYV